MDKGILSHDVGGPGIVSWLYADPAAKTVAAVLTNAAHGVPVGRGVTNPGEDEYACRPGDRQQIGENIKAVLARHIQVQQDDIGLLTRGQPDRRIQVAGLADDVQVGLLLDEHAEPGPDHGVVVDDHDPERRANCISHSTSRCGGTSMPQHSRRDVTGRGLIAGSSPPR